MRRALACLLLTVAIGCDRQPLDESLLIQLELVARLDNDATTERAPWGAVVDIELGDDGSVFVLDGVSRTVSVFDRAGVPRASFGGRGRGPGELERPAGMTWDPEGTLWVVDLGTGRLSAYEAGGALVATLQAARAAPVTPLAIRFLTPFLLKVVGLDFAAGSLEQPAAVLIDLAVAGGVVEPVGHSVLSFVRWPDVFDYRTEDVTLLMAVPFSPEPLFGIDRAGHLWYGDGATGRVRRWVVADSFDVSTAQEASQVPITLAEIGARLEENGDVQELEARGGAAVLAELMDRIPEHHPQVDGFFFGDDETVWVMRSAGQGGEGVIDVFDGSGELLGVARTDLAVTPRPRMHDDLLVGVVRDELGVESVALFRVVG